MLNSRFVWAAVACAVALVDARTAWGLTELEEDLEGIRKRFHLPAMAAAAVRDGEIVEIAATGVRKAGSPEEVTVDDAWNVGSCTKSMTATLAAMLVEQGKITWETTVAEVFPELKDVMDDDWQDVTLEQLLNHRAGAPAHAPDDLWMRAWEQRGTPTQQRLRFVGGLITRAPDQAPGSKFVYSNQGYAIAGAMLERVTGESWEDMLRNRIFEPLGMHSAGFGAPGREDMVDQPWGHSGSGRKPEPVPPGPHSDNPPAIGPAATVYCSVGDLARYCAFHAAQGRSSPRLLTPESFRRLHTGIPQGFWYSLGWIVQKRAWAGGEALMHTGSNTMFYCAMWVAPAKNMAFIAATNIASDVADNGCDAAIKAMVERLLGGAHHEVGGE